jgi:uncharacterized protein DUF2877
MQFLNALSCTPAVNNWLTNSCQPRILHVFDHACNLINERREVLSIVTPHIGKGPFSIVVQDDLLFSKRLDVESPIVISADQLILGSISIDTTDAEVWNPCPDWETLHTKRDQISAQVKQLPDINFQFSNSLASAIAIADLHSALIAAKGLAGLGIGLTPAGDDFIIGTLLATWIIHPAEIVTVLAEEIAETAASLTTSLSAAWLRSAGRGETGILWHEFFDALVSGDIIQIHFKMDNILAVGKTSGVDALAGFSNTFISYVERENHVVPKLV